MTREEVVEIMNYCKFIELPHSGSFVPVPSFAGTTGRKQKNTPATPSGLKEMEIRTPAGSAIRIAVS